MGRLGLVCWGLTLKSDGPSSNFSLLMTRYHLIPKVSLRCHQEMVSCGDCQEDEDVEIRSFVQGLGQSADRFARILPLGSPFKQKI